MSANAELLIELKKPFPRGEVFTDLLDEGADLGYMFNGESLMEIVISRLDKNLFFLNEVLKRMDDIYRKFNDMTIPRIADRKKSMESLKRFNELVNFSSDEEAEKYDLNNISTQNQILLLKERTDLSPKWLEMIEEKAILFGNIGACVETNRRIQESGVKRKPGYIADMILKAYKDDLEFDTGRAESKVPNKRLLELIDGYLGYLTPDEVGYEIEEMERTMPEQLLECYRSELLIRLNALKIHETTNLAITSMKPKKMRLI